MQAGLVARVLVPSDHFIEAVLVGIARREGVADAVKRIGIGPSAAMPTTLAPSPLNVLCGGNAGSSSALRVATAHTAGAAPPCRPSKR